MSELEQKNDTSPWLSTYGLVTAERILGSFNIQLSTDDLSSALSNSHSLFNRFLTLPLRNVLNGIIMQQAHDYQVYVQKLYVDYLLSGENSKSEESSGGLTRSELEEERKALIDFGEAFHAQEIAQEHLIADSQALLIQKIKHWRQQVELVVDGIKKSCRELDIDTKKISIERLLSAINAYEGKGDFFAKEGPFWGKLEGNFEQKLPSVFREKVVLLLQPLLDEAELILQQSVSLTEKAFEMHQSLKMYRQSFYDTVLRVVELMKNLSEYKIDKETDEVNRELLHFDKALGN